MFLGYFKLWGMIFWVNHTLIIAIAADASEPIRVKRLLSALYCSTAAAISG